MKMRKEVDFSKGVRGKFFGDTNVVGPIEDEMAKPDVVKAVQAELKRLGVWEMLDRSKRTQLLRSIREIAAR